MMFSNKPQIKYLHLVFLIFWFDAIPAFSQGAWTQKNDFGGSARRQGVGFSIGSKGYIGTGYDGTYQLNDFWEYDPAKDAWTQKANVGGYARRDAASFVIGGKGYITCGWGGSTGTNLGDLWEYDPSNNKWTQKASLPGDPRWGPSGFAIGSKGYIGCGYNTPNHYKDFWEYNPATNSWTQKANYGGVVRTNTMSFTLDTLGYIGMGHNNASGYLQDFWSYSPTTNTWTQRANYGGGKRIGPTGISHNGKGYVACGYNGSVQKKDFWEYDPTKNSWTQLKDFGGAERNTASGFSVAGKIYIGTGNNGAASKDFWEWNSCGASISSSRGNKLCVGDTTVLTASPTGSGRKYLWSTNDTTTTIRVFSSGTYTLTITDTAQCSATANITMKVNQLPTPTITVSGSTSFCQGDSVKLTTTTYAKYKWSNLDSSQGVIIRKAGKYSVEVTDTNGCKAISSESTITVHSLPIANITADGPLTICKGDTLVLISDNSSKYLWSTMGTSQKTKVNAAGNYWLMVTDSNNCSDTSEILTVSMFPLVSANITLQGPASFCKNDSVKLMSSLAKTYLWSNGSKARDITVKTSGLYSVSIIDSNNCRATSNPMLITVHELPKPFILNIGTLAFCPGDSVILYTHPSKSYLWSNNEVTQSIRVFDSGQYTLIATDSNGCSGTTETITTEKYGKPGTTIASSGSNTFCEGDSVILTAPEGNSFLWNSLHGTRNITVNQRGVFWVKVTDSNGCSSVSSTISVSVNPLPNTKLISSGNNAFCEGDSVILAALGDWSGYEWNNGTQTPAVVAKTKGNFWVRITDSAGCSSNSDTAFVDVFPLPEKPVINAIGNTLNSGVVSGNQWFYNGDSLKAANGQIFEAKQNGFYVVSVTDKNGCTSFSNPFELKTGGISNGTNGQLSIFPNPGKGSFTLESNGIVINRILIVDLLGRKVYESNDSFEELNLLHLKEGTYFVQVHSELANYRLKLIVQ